MDSAILISQAMLLIIAYSATTQTASKLLSNSNRDLKPTAAQCPSWDTNFELDKMPFVTSAGIHCILPPLRSRNAGEALHDPSMDFLEASHQLCLEEGECSL